MDARDFLTDDGRAVLALCSAFGADDTSSAEAAPYTLSEWNQLARAIQSSNLQRPAALAGRSTEELTTSLAVPSDEAERIRRLLDRGAVLAPQLEELFARGIWAVTRADPRYPARLKQTLKHQAPSVLFGSGEIEFLQRGGVAVVGSRNIDEEGTAFARLVGKKCAESKMPVVSGGARGTDRIAMEAAVEAGGAAFGVLADSLERTVRQPDLRELLLEGRLVLLTPYSPTAGFSVGAAMGRNKVIYGLADFGVVVSSDFEKGGTWAGAVENLKAGWCPLCVRAGEGAPKGNRELLKQGAVALEESKLSDISDFAEWLRANAVARQPEPELFPQAAHEGRARYRRRG
jgi:predicted Rossmann fold nucleotide-binding protein DprA/Smf involved in DNA uptake